MTLVLLLSAGLTVGFFGAVYPLKGTFIRDLIMGRQTVNMERVIFQGTTLMMFFLSMANVILKGLRLRREKKALKWDPIPAGIDLQDTAGLIKVYERVRAYPKMAKCLALARCARVLAMWINTQDFERSSQYAKEENELDIFVSDSSFRFNRMFIWAMPLLGFVGTVYGVSYGIGGFADFLRGTVTAEEIKVQVGLITEGLAVAFFCTLLGLCTAGIAAFPGLAAERKEEATLESIDQYVQDRLISKMPSVRKAEFPVDQIVAIRQGIENIKFNFPVDDLSRALEKSFKGFEGLKFDFPVDELAKAIDEGFRRLPDPDRYEQVFSKAVASAGSMVNEKYDEFARGYENRIDALAGVFANKLGAVAESFERGSQRISEQLASLGQQQSQDFASAHEKHLSALTDLDTKEIARWEGMVGEFRELAAQMTDQFKQAVNLMETTSNQYAQRIDESSKRLGDQFVKIVDVGARIDQMLKAAVAMETALVKISSADEFGKTLASLRSHLGASDELVKKISRPRSIVLQEVRG